MGDVGERAAVHHHRLTLEGLHEVRLQRVLEQHGHGARRAEVLRGNGLAAVVGVRRGDAADPLAEVLEVARHRHDRHHLGGRGDVEPGLARVAVGPATETDGDPPQRAIVHVHGPAPADRSASILCGLPCRIEASIIAASRLFAAPMA